MLKYTTTYILNHATYLGCVVHRSIIVSALIFCLPLFFCKTNIFWIFLAIFLATYLERVLLICNVPFTLLANDWCFMKFTLFRSLQYLNRFLVNSDLIVVSAEYAECCVPVACHIYMLISCYDAYNYFYYVYSIYMWIVGGNSYSLGTRWKEKQRVLSVRASHID